MDRLQESESEAQIGLTAPYPPAGVIQMLNSIRLILLAQTEAAASRDDFETELRGRIAEDIRALRGHPAHGGSGWYDAVTRISQMVSRPHQERNGQ